MLHRGIKYRSCGWRRCGHCLAAASCRCPARAAIGQRCFVCSSPDHRSYCPPRGFSPIKFLPMLQVLRGWYGVGDKSKQSREIAISGCGGGFLRGEGLISILTSNKEHPSKRNPNTLKQNLTCWLQAHSKGMMRLIEYRGFLL